MENLKTAEKLICQLNRDMFQAGQTSLVAKMEKWIRVLSLGGFVQEDMRLLEDLSVKKCFEHIIRKLV